MQRLTKVAIRATVAIAALAVLFHFVPFRAVASSLGGLDPFYVLTGVVLQYAVRAISTVRMKVIADSQGIHLSHRTLFRILLATQFYSMVLPGPIAGGGATWVKYVQHGSDRRAAAVAIVLNRGVSFLVMLTVGAAALFIDLRRAQTWATAAGVVAGVSLLALANRRWLADRRPRGPAGGSRIGRLSRDLLDRVLLFGRIPAQGKARVLLASVACEVVGAAVMWAFARAAGLHLSLLTVFWIRAALQVVLTLPISIAGLGVREAGLVGLGALIGVPAALAVSWSLTIFFGSVVVAATGGLLESGTLTDGVLRLRERTRRSRVGADRGAE